MGGRDNQRPHNGCLLLARIVGRIDVNDFEWPLTVYLNDRLAGCPSIMIHVRRHRRKSAGLKSRCVLLVQLVTHPSMEAPRQNGNVFRGWMMMCRNLVAGW